ARRRTRLDQRGPEVLGDAMVELVEQRRLAREVQEEGAAADVRLLADVDDRDRREAGLGEQAHGRLVDLAAGALLLAVAPGRLHGAEPYSRDGLVSMFGVE